MQKRQRTVVGSSRRDRTSSGWLVRSSPRSGVSRPTTSSTSNSRSRSRSWIGNDEAHSRPHRRHHRYSILLHSHRHHESSTPLIVIANHCSNSSCQPINQSTTGRMNSTLPRVEDRVISSLSTQTRSLRHWIYQMIYLSYTHSLTHGHATKQASNQLIERDRLLDRECCSVKQQRAYHTIEAHQSYYRVTVPLSSLDRSLSFHRSLTHVALSLRL